MADNWGLLDVRDSWWYPYLPPGFRQALLGGNDYAETGQARPAPNGGLLALGSEFSTGADVRDYNNYTQSAFENYKKGAVSQGLLDTGYAGAALAMTLLPGSASGVRQVVEEGAGAVSDALSASRKVDAPVRRGPLYDEPRRIDNPIRGFHGSPHDFPPVRLIEMPDGTRLYQNMHELPETPQGARIIREYPLGRFDMSKIGSGQGAQTYGHGLYFAENEGVARTYRGDLTETTWLVNGEPVEALTSSPTFKGTPEAYAANAMWRFGGNKDEAIAFLSQPGNMSAEKAAADVVRSGSFEKVPGSMYEVAIHARPEEFLDWDRPLSEQGEASLSSVRNLWDEMNLSGSPSGLSGEGIWGSLTADLSRYGGRDNTARELARKYLSESGIPGIRYLDEGSRNPALEPYWSLVRGSDGATYRNLIGQDNANAALAEAQKLAPDANFRLEGPFDKRTRNYVLFDDSLIEILRKYGLLGPMLAGGGYGLLSGDEEPAY